MFDICSNRLIKAVSEVGATNTKSVWAHEQLIGCPLCLAGCGKGAGLQRPVQQTCLHTTPAFAVLDGKDRLPAQVP